MPSPIALQKRLKILVIIFGICGIYIDASRAAEEPPSPQPDDGLWVEVEPTNLLPSDITGIYYLVPYRSRRAPSGHMMSLGYSSFKPANYEPNFYQNAFSDIYKNAETPMIELQYVYKLNYSFGSFGLDFGIGFYNNDSDDSTKPSQLQLIPVRLGAIFYLDTLYFEPYLVPYAAGGVYTVFYEESLSGESAFGGNTQVAPYASLGVAFQLNWIDRDAARVSYMESGVENTFLYVEAKKLFASQAAQDPDLSTGFDWGAGMRVEF